MALIVWTTEQELRRVSAGNYGRIQEERDEYGFDVALMRSAPLTEAASEMLEALKDAVEQLKFWNGDTAEAEAAIAKAEGRS